MPDVLRIPYSVRNPTMGDVGLLPYLPVTLGYEGKTTSAAGLVDSGSMFNVLPYALGLELGAFWSEQPATIRLMGNLSRFPARPLVLTAQVGHFAPIQLAFAWTQAEDAPLILGQMNFFIEFGVCFFVLSGSLKCSRNDKETRTMLLPMMRERLLTALAGTPDVLDGLLRPLGPNDALWDMRPDPDRFTLREALAHLVDYEAVWWERLHRTREEEQPELLSVDRDRLAVDHDYAHCDTLQSRAAFRRQRAELVEYLRGLSPEDWQRVGLWAGPGGGPLTLEEQAAFVAIHDGYHTQQVAQWTARN